MSRILNRFISAEVVAATFRFHAILCLLIVPALCSAIPVMAQETITYSGQSGVLQSINAASDSLGPTVVGTFNSSRSKSLQGNVITLSSGFTVPGNVYGASAEVSAADPNGISSNQVFILGTVGPGSLGIYGYVYGGYEFSSSNEVKNNRVEIIGGTVSKDAYGGFSIDNNVTGNSVKISNNGTVGLSVTGGRSNGGGTATGNSVEIISGHVGRVVYGGFSGTGNTIKNSVMISGGQVGDGTSPSGNVYGGDSWGNGGNGLGNAQSNSVTISGGLVEKSVYGGRSGNNRGDTTQNSVLFIGGMVGQHVYGGNSPNGNSTKNTVTLNGGTVGQHVYGGNSTNGNSTENSVTINGGTVNGNVYGGWSKNNATGNTVTLNGGTVKGNVIGGYSSTVNATGNEVTLVGGTILGDIYGGWVGTSGNATGNSVTIRNTPNLTAANLYGGRSGTGDAFTDNTFNLHSVAQAGGTTDTVTVAGLRNFQNLNFYLLPSTQAGETMLKVTDTADIDHTTVHVVFDVAGSSLKSGDKVNLIDALGTGSSLIGDPDNATHSATRMLFLSRARRGATLEYEVEIAVEDRLASGDPGRLVLRLLGTEPEVLPETEDLNNGYLTGIMQLNQGGDLVAGQTLMSKAMCAAKRPNLRGWGAFGDIAGNWSRYHTGEQTDLSGMNLIVGLSRCMNVRSLPRQEQIGTLTLGGFFEYGDGSYHSLGTFDNAHTVHSYGNLNHFGGGLLGRIDFTGVRSGSGHYYLDGSLRAGAIGNNYHSDLCDSFGTAANYATSSAYYGAHFGGGRVWNFANSSFDLYGKYLWTQQQGDTVTLSTGDPIEFQRVNSHRVRLGGRYVFATSRRLSPYFGAAWEREFDGIARATAHGDYAINATSLRGNSGFGEVGMTWKPAANHGFYADLNLKGYTGKREGVAATLSIGRNF